MNLLLLLLRVSKSKSLKNDVHTTIPTKLQSENYKNESDFEKEECPNMSILNLVLCFFLGLGSAPERV